MPQELNSSFAGCAEPLSSKTFTISLSVSLPFGDGLIALPFPIPCSLGADHVASQQTDTTRGLELVFLPRQTQLCHAHRTPQVWGRGRRKGEQPWQATATPGYCPGEACGCLLLYSLTPCSFTRGPHRQQVLTRAPELHSTALFPPLDPVPSTARCHVTPVSPSIQKPDFKDTRGNTQK